MNRLYIIACLLAFTSTDTLAEERQRDYKGGMKHSYIRKAEPTPSPPPASKKTETVTEVKDTVGGKDTKDTAEKTPDKPAVEVWKKYRALTGSTEDNTKEAKQEDKPNTPEKPELPEIAKAKEKFEQRRADRRQAKASKPTGMAAIINDYRINKERRSQVRSIQINKPDTPIVEKPKIEN